MTLIESARGYLQPGLVLFLAALIFVRAVLTDGFLRLLGRSVLIPVAALYALGLLGAVMLRLKETVVALGDIRFSVMMLIRGAITGALLFWLGSWSNRPSAHYIKAQPALRPATRALAVTAAGVAIFGAAVLLLVSILGIDGGRNKYGSPVLVAIWDALKARGTTMPYPRRVVALRHG